MINLSSKTRTRITRNVEIAISGDELLEVLNEHFKGRGLNNVIPADASVSVHIPGGGDWSNEDLDISSNNPVKISWTEEEGSES